VSFLKDTKLPKKFFFLKTLLIKDGVDPGLWYGGLRFKQWITQHSLKHVLINCSPYRTHFDPASPASNSAASNSTASISAASPSSLPCPLCHAHYATSLELERHVNRDHCDVLSPMMTKRRPSLTSSTASSSASTSAASLRQVFKKQDWKGFQSLAANISVKLVPTKGWYRCQFFWWMTKIVQI
jgi:hypothetical protein